MCEPTTIIAGVTAAIGIGSQLIAADAQNKAHDQAEKLAGASAKNSMQLLALRQQQEARAGAQTIYQQDLQARKADAQTRVAAGESGVAGASIDALLADVDRQRLMADSQAKLNTQGTIDQLDQEKSVVQTNRQQQVNATPAANPAATAIKIGGAAADAAASYDRVRRENTK